MSGGYLAGTTGFGDVPLFAFHGVKDIAIPALFSMQMVSILEETGRTPIYTDCGPWDCQGHVRDGDRLRSRDKT